MTKETRLLNLSEAAHLLGIKEEELQKLAEAGEVLAYKVGGVFLRFKAEQLLQAKPLIREKLEELLKNPKKITKAQPKKRRGFFETLREFWYFYDFYIIALLLIVFILCVILELRV